MINQTKRQCIRRLKIHKSKKFVEKADKMKIRGKCNEAFSYTDVIEEGIICEMVLFCGDIGII